MKIAFSAGASLPTAPTRSRRGMHTIAITAAMLALVGCAPLNGSTEHPDGAELPQLVTINAPRLHPEGIEWDADGDRFLVSSASEGTVTSVTDDGSVELFADDELTSTLGTCLDAGRKRLLVTGADFSAVSDPTVAGESKLAIYDLTTGELEEMVDLAGLGTPGRRLANDVTIDTEGNAYVTDSLSPVIYRVTPDGKASVFVENARFAPADGLGLNGIAYHPDGYLLAAMGGGQDTIYRIPLNRQEEITEVTLPEPIDGDGLTLRPDGNLVVAAPLAPAVLELASNNNWASAHIVAEAPTSADGVTTNTALRDGQVYAVNAHLGDLISGGPPVPTFEIFRADLR